MRGFASIAIAGAALVACASREGVYVDVTVPDASITHVQLFIGAFPCTDPRLAGNQACNAITPQGQAATLAVGNNGGAFFQDADSAFTAKVSGKVAHFHLEAPRDEMVELVAVGFAGDPAAVQPSAAKVLDSIDIMAKSAVQIETTLEPAMPVPANEMSRGALTDGNYVLEWASPTAPGECVLVEQWSNSHATRTFVVPEEDADCDGLPTFSANGQRNPLECDPLWFDRKTPVASGASDCATIVSNAGTDVCLLAGAACVDGAGVTSGTCARLSVDFCLPHDVCATTCAQPNGLPIGTCLDTMTAGGDDFVNSQCVVYADASGMPCAVTNPDHAHLDFAPLLADGTAKCTSVKFATSLDDFVAQETSILAPTDFGVMFDTQFHNDPCSLDLVWKGDALAPVAATSWMLFDLALDNGKHLVVPVGFARDSCTAVGAEGNGFDCSVFAPSSQDSIVTCAM